MGIMQFDAQPIQEVIAFVKKHYKGGTILDYGCGCGRYANCFPEEEYTGVDGYRGNVDFCMETWPDRRWEYQDLETWKPKKKYDYLFSSVVLDQVENLPLGWAKNYILIENKKYIKIFKPKIDEPLDGSEETRKMLC